VLATYFSIIVKHLYKMGSDEILQQYVLEFERRSIPVDTHGGVAKGHYVGRVTAQKVLHTGLWWPTLQLEIHFVGPIRPQGKKT